MRISTLALIFGVATIVACGSSSDTVGDGSGTDDAGGGGNGTDGGGGGNNTEGGGGNNTEGGGGGNTEAGGGGKTNNAIKKVFIIMMENHSWATIKAQATKSAKYINGTMLTTGGHAEAYSTPKGNHPSEPNYIWLEAGDNLGITTDDPPATNHKATKDHLVTQLETAGFTWKAYAEDSGDGKSCPLADTALFGTKHTPMLFFDDVTDTNKAASQHCIDHIRPYTDLANDLKGTVADYNFITPNLCNDMHGQATGATCFSLTSDLIQLGNDWLQTNLPPIVTYASANAGAVFVIWDEGDESLGQTAADGPVPVFVFGALAKPGFSSPTAFTHSSTLKTVEEIFNLPLLGDAKNATDLKEFFTSFP